MAISLSYFKLTPFGKKYFKIFLRIFEFLLKDGCAIFSSNFSRLFPIEDTITPVIFLATYLRMSQRETGNKSVQGNSLRKFHYGFC